MEALLTDSNEAKNSGPANVMVRKARMWCRELEIPAPVAGGRGSMILPTRGDLRSPGL